MKKIIFGTIFTVFALALVVVPAFAAGKSMPKTTGDVGYTVGFQRYADFNAIATSNTCSVNLTGSYIFSLYGGTYIHDITLVQTGSNIAVTGGYPAGATPYIYDETGTGTITGNTFDLMITYAGVGYTYTVTGTVNPDGSLTITGGTFLGSDWTVSGNANTVVTGCTAKGTFHYSDVNGDWYYANVQYVNVDGTDAYFAGLVTSASNPTWVGNWVQVAVNDGGEPAYLVDSIWGIFTDANTAKYNVANKVRPNGQFVITSGNLQVHK